MATTKKRTPKRKTRTAMPFVRRLIKQTREAEKEYKRKQRKKRGARMR